MALTSRSITATKLTHEMKCGLTLLLVGSLAHAAITYYGDVEPILQQHCQSCHRAGEAAPMSFATYSQTRPWAAAIAEQVTLRKMPPWFAAKGHFANDPSLTEQQISIIREWAGTGAKEGVESPGSTLPTWPEGWNIPRQDAVFEMLDAFPVPALGAVEYQYFAIPTHFEKDRWITAVEVRPGARANVHHVVVYVRPKDSLWLKDGNNTIPPKNDILAIYTPGTQARILPEGMALKVEAGSYLVFQIHYTTNGKAALDRTKIGLKFSDVAPRKRVLTLQMGNSTFSIPPGEANYPVLVRGTLPNDAELLSLFPHMHLRGRAFEYRIIPPRGPSQILLRVEPYDFYWQLNYILLEPHKLTAGTKFEWEAWFDNSPNNKKNPDPKATVRYGEQSWEEMMIGFFEVAVPVATSKESFFERIR